MCLTDTPNDPLARRPFRVTTTLSSQDRQMTLTNSLVDCGCTGAYTVINEALVPEVCKRLQIEPYPLSKPKPLRGYDGQLSKRPITHCLLPTLDVHGHKEGSCPILIAQLGQHDLILGKPWMNKHGVILDMLKDKVLFVPGRCEHDDNKVSTAEDLSFLPTTPSVVITRPPKPTAKDESDEDSSGMDHSKDTSNRKRSTPTPRALKEKMIKEPDLIDIAEIGAPAYYHLARNKENKLFSLTMNEIYDTPCEPPPTKTVQRDNRIPLNKPYPCGSESKYKKCCGSYTPKTVQINNAEVLTPQEMLNRLPVDYHNYADVFDRSKTDVLPPHRSYDHKLEFAENADKNALPKSRIYPLSGHKLEQVKKYLDEHLRKGFIVPSHAPFASPVLFAEKPNGGLRFCVDYRKLNAITKRNRYPIPLIDEVLAKIQDCKYLTRLNIIATFNKLRMHPDNENFTTFVTSLETYKYRMLPFGLTNDPATYQQYMNDILFEYLNDFCQAYLDDILIYSKTKKDHVKHVRLILQKLREAGLQVDILKCEFHVQETKFLGLLVSIDGLRMDPAKIQAVVDWATPTNLKEVQAFIGFCNFYRRFIRDFSKIVKPMISLTGKGIIFDWSPACQEAFKQLKINVTQAPTLRHFDRSKEAILETDSSDYVNGGVLSQYDDEGVLHPVAFYSKNLTPAECNYQIYDKELLAIIRCLKH